MKKVISLFLALLMAFSFMTVASAEGTSTEAPENSESTDAIPEGALGEFDWLLDLPFWTVGPALKFAKIAFKLVSVYLKVAKIFGLVEEDMDDMILNAIAGLIESAQKGEAAPETGAEGTESTTPAAQPA